MDFPASSAGYYYYSSSSRVDPSAGSRRDEDRGEFEDERRAAAKHPKHLKGRDIGMWYAQRNKSRPPGEPRLEFLSNVSIDQGIARRLDECMKRLESEMLVWTPDPGRPVTKLFACGSSSGGPRIQPNPPEAVLETRVRLPVYKARAEILQAINENQVTIISGETGSGKTTQVPQFILDQFLEDEKAKHCFIVCTQPRRISAITVAERVAYERGETVGQNSVGYRIRLESRDPKGDSGKILFCTTGIVLQFLQSDPLLKNVTHLIVDEIHERSTDSDLLLAVLREKILPQRPSLKVVCMSATLDSATFVQYFGEPCGRISVEGKLFPVANYFLEEFISRLRYNPEPQMGFDQKVKQAKLERAHRLEKHGYSKPLVQALGEISMLKVDSDLVVACVEYICANTKEGAILVFLPGWEGISEVCRKLSEISNDAISPGNTLVLPLHSMLPTSDQRLVFDIPPPGVRKIIVSTVLAETSVTIEDVVYVVDSGKTKLTTIDVAKNNLNCFGELWIAKANASQRLGRAGRVRAGECFKLYTRMDYEAMQDYQTPEMVRSTLENLILYVKELDLGEPQVFLPRCISPPSSEAVENSIQFLIQLKALDKQGRVTTLGKFLSCLPTEPRLGKLLILGALFGCLEPVTSICAALDFKDPFVQPLFKRQEVDAIRIKFSEDSESDHIMVANAVESAIDRGERYLRANFLSPQTMKMLKNLRKQYKTHLTDQGLVETCTRSTSETLRAVICGGLYPGIAMAKSKPQRHRGRENGAPFRLGRMSTNTERSINFHPKSVLARQQEFNTLFFAYFLMQRMDSGVSLYDATAVHPLSLLIFANDVAYDFGQKIFTVNKWMRIHCECSDAMLINRLRTSLDYVLDCFLRRERNMDHKDFIILLSNAFDKERCGVVRAAFEESMKTSDW